MKLSVFKLILYLIGFSLFLSSQDSSIREDLIVLNVEVPVRVIYKGKLIDNLHKDDFKLFENGKEREINGFYIEKRKISNQIIEIESEKTKLPKKRFFVLAFSVTNFNKFYENGVKYFFENVLKQGDKLLVFINNTTITFNNLNDKNLKLKEILTSLKDEGKKARRNLRFASIMVGAGVRNLVTKLNSLARHGGRSIAESEVLSFFQQYSLEWEKFKRNYLQLDIYALYNFSEFLKKVSEEKWVISFYQYEQFPVIDFSSIGGQRISMYMGRESRRLIKDINREFNAGHTFPYEEVSKMFYNLGTIFNLVVIPSRIESDSESLSSKTLNTAAEITLREITKRTGGSISFSTNLKESISKIVEKEDISYILTYEPLYASKERKIKITVDNKKYNLRYDNNQRADFIKKKMKRYLEREKIVKLDNLRFSDKKLAFNLENFVLKQVKKKSHGVIEVNIIIKASTGEILFDEKKIIKPEKDPTKLSVTFNWLVVGKYDLIIDIKDLYSKHKAFEYLKFELK